MAFFNDTRTRRSDLALEISASIHRLMLAWSDYRLYRKSIRALSKLDSRELADIGLHDSSIRSAARKAVYGTPD